MHEEKTMTLYTEEEVLSWPTHPLNEIEMNISTFFGEWLDEYCDGLTEQCMDEASTAPLNKKVQ